MDTSAPTASTPTDRFLSLTQRPQWQALPQHAQAYPASTCVSCFPATQAAVSTCGSSPPKPKPD